MPDDANNQMVTVKVTREMRQRLKIRAARKGMTVQQLLSSILESALKEDKSKESV